MEVEKYRYLSKDLDWGSFGLERPGEARPPETIHLAWQLVPESWPWFFFPFLPNEMISMLLNPLFLQCVVYGFRSIAQIDIGTLQQGQKFYKEKARDGLGKVYVRVARLWACSHQAEDIFWLQVSAIALNQTPCVCMCFCRYAYIIGQDTVYQPNFVKKFPWPWQKQQTAQPASLTSSHICPEAISIV